MPEVELSETPQGASSTQSAGSDSSKAGVAGYSVSLPTFEGPLDLLLHLCQKHELDILDIPIGFVTEKYLEYLAVMQLIDLDVASEYLVMAATLAHIKSKVLLPAPPAGQEDEVDQEEIDPRAALIRRLLEYQKYKQAGVELAHRGTAMNDSFGRGAPIEEAVHTGTAPLAGIPLFSLVEAFQGILERSKVKLSHDIVHERITLTDRINELVDVLRTKRKIAFEELFTGLTTRFDLVITFLAILEMTKLRMTRISQPEPMGPIYIEFSAQVEESEEHSFDFDKVQIDGAPKPAPAAAGSTEAATAASGAAIASVPTSTATATASTTSGAASADEHDRDDLDDLDADERDETFTDDVEDARAQRDADLETLAEESGLVFDEDSLVAAALDEENGLAFSSDPSPDSPDDAPASADASPPSPPDADADADAPEGDPPTTEHPDGREEDPT